MLYINVYLASSDSTEKLRDDFGSDDDEAAAADDDNDDDTEKDEEELNTCTGDVIVSLVTCLLLLLHVDFNDVTSWSLAVDCRLTGGDLSRCNVT